MTVRVSRRQFLKFGAAGVGASSMAMMGFAPDEAVASVRNFKLSAKQATDGRVVTEAGVGQVQPDREMLCSFTELAYLAHRPMCASWSDEALGLAVATRRIGPGPDYGASSDEESGWSGSRGIGNLPESVALRHQRTMH